MFDFFKDIAKATGEIVGTVTGPIIGLSYDIIANTLGITIEMVKEAINAGCRTYEDIKKYHDL